MVSDRCLGLVKAIGDVFSEADWRGVLFTGTAIYLLMCLISTRSMLPLCLKLYMLRRIRKPH